MITGYYDGQVNIWNAETQAQPPNGSLNLPKQVNCLATSKNQLFLGNSNLEMTVLQKGSFKQSKIKVAHYCNYDMTLKSNEEGNRLYFVQMNSRQQPSVIDLDTNRIKYFKPLKDDIYSLSSEEQILKIFIHAGNKGHVVISKLINMKVRKCVLMKEKKDISSLKIIKEKHQVVFGNMGRTVDLFCLKTFKVLHSVVIMSGVYSIHVKQNLIALGHNNQNFSIVNLDRVEEYKNNT